MLANDKAFLSGLFAVLVFLGSPALCSVQVVSPCCAKPFSSLIIYQLTSTSSSVHYRTLEANAGWLSDQLNNQSTDELESLQVALQAYCISSTCGQDLQLAKAVVAERLAQRALTQDREERWVDRAVELFCALISVIGAIVASFAAGWIQPGSKKHRA